MNQEFDINKIYYTRVGVSIEGLPGTSVTQMLRDGRFLSPIMENLNIQTFHNLCKKGSNDHSDFEWNGHKPIEQRILSLSSGSAYLYPAVNKGGYRSFSESNFRDKLDIVSGFIIVCQLPTSVLDVVESFVPSDYIKGLKNVREITRPGLYKFLETQEGYLTKKIQSLVKASDGRPIPGKFYELDKASVKL